MPGDNDERDGFAPRPSNQRKNPNSERPEMAPRPASAAIFTPTHPRGRAPHCLGSQMMTRLILWQTRARMRPQTVPPVAAPRPPCTFTLLATFTARQGSRRSVVPLFHRSASRQLSSPPRAEHAHAAKLTRGWYPPHLPHPSAGRRHSPPTSRRGSPAARPAALGPLPAPNAVAGDNRPRPCMALIVRRTAERAAGPPLEPPPALGGTWPTPSTRKLVENARHH